MCSPLFCLNPQWLVQVTDQATSMVLPPLKKLVLVPWLTATISLFGCKQMFVLSPRVRLIKMSCRQGINSLLHVVVSQGSPSRIQVLLCQMHSECPVPHHPSEQGDIPPLPNGSQWQHHAGNQHEGSEWAGKRQQGKVESVVVAHISTGRQESQRNKISPN